MGFKWPSESKCPEKIVVGGVTYIGYSLTGSFQRTNILSVYVVTVCHYENAAGNITTVEHTRVLWVLDFPW